MFKTSRITHLANRRRKTYISNGLVSTSMIVNAGRTGLILVDQIDHADLASQFASFWGSDSFSKSAPFVETALAARFHDEGYRYFDDQPKLDQNDGRPFNYNNLPTEISLRVHEESVNSVRSLPLYTQLLVSMHRTGLLRKRNGTADIRPRQDYIPPPKSSELPPPRSGFESFVRCEESRQEETLKALSKSSELGALSTKEIVWTNYKLLQVWDRLSLHCCSLHSENEEIFPVPTSYSGKDASITLTRVEESKFRVNPWPFKIDHFNLSVLAHALQKNRYSSQQELLDGLYNGKRESLSFEFSKE